MSLLPTIVLVHGALFNSTGWNRVQNLLQIQGHNVVTVDVPGRSGDGLDPRSIDINVAAEKVANVVRRLNGSVILVGHSQGGAVITQAMVHVADHVKGLVYIAAVVPLSGETAFQGLNPERDNTFPLTVTPSPEQGLFVLSRQGPLEESFFQDLRAVDPELADAALASMVSEPIGIGTTALSYDQGRFAALPKFYIEALQDRVVTPATQREFQRRVPMTKVYSLETGHSPFLSQPAEVTKILHEVARTVR